MSTRLFGEPVRRVEDPAILRGEAEYLDDLPASDAIHLSIVRSTMAHATVTNIETAAARTAAGVVAVVTAADLGADNGPRRHPTWFPVSDGLRAAADPLLREEFLQLLATDRVRYAGQPVAAVLAESPYLAADSSALVSVDYAPLPVISDISGAMTAGAALLNPAWGDNVSSRFHLSKGHVRNAFADAHAVIRDEFTMGRQTGTPLEPRGVLAIPDGDRMTVWSSTQAPHWLRDALAGWSGLPTERLRVCAPFVGGGFGIKSMVYPEEILVPLLAMRLHRPVKWVETRSEHFLAAVHSRDQRHCVELAVSADGRVLGLRDSYIVDVGASNVEALVVPYNTAAHLQGAYRIPALEIDCTCVVTNKSPLSSYRGAGRPEAVFALERIFDRAARELRMDPLEFRRRNLIAAAEMPCAAGIPYRDGTPMVLDVGDVPRSLTLAAERAGYADWRERQQTFRAEGRYIGIGMATYVEGTGIGPGERVEVVADGSGDVRVIVPLPCQGQGHPTTLAQICADRLDFPLSRITVIQGDTLGILHGGGTIASRVATVVGNSVDQAARSLRDLLIRRAAEALEADPADVEIANERLSVRGAAQKSISLAELAADGPLACEGEFTPPAVTFASGAHVAVVDVDPRTGMVRVLKYVAAHDCGRMINPAIVEGQVIGGIAQGIGGALLEELVYDDYGQLLTGSFMDYLPPRTTDMPDIDIVHLETPSLRNPMGIKGVGEAGAIAPPAAIANAVEDALAPFGAAVTRCPLSPHVVAQLVTDEALASAPEDPRIEAMMAASRAVDESL
jgi:aerobic carbon-monoxide dehydrogenase large subunit